MALHYLRNAITKSSRYFPTIYDISISKTIYRSENSSNYTQKYLHTSAQAFKRRKTAEERKVSRIISYGPKSKSEIVDVWRGITLEELAKILDNNVNYVQDLFIGTVRGRNTEVHDIKLLQDAIKRSGRRIRLIGKPIDVVKERGSRDIVRRPPPKDTLLLPRAPVVTVMGHVDHGKTTLLDALRNANVVDQEFGGITQHIGAFSVQLPGDRRITFLDTPGHAAFAAMRERGANITDIVVLVVAADDGVMEQTVESIRMAKDAKAPILVAINKIDAPLADIERTKLSLVQAGIQVESMGGEVQAIPISALKKQNLNQLTEALLLQADLLELGADVTGPVEAVVVESKIHPHRGRLCTVVVQRGTLKRGAVLIAGTCLAKVRTLRDADGNEFPANSAILPGYPVEVEGWRELPSAGELVLEAESERSARVAIKYREEKAMAARQGEDSHAIAAKEAQHELEYRARVEKKRSMGRVKHRETGPRKKEIAEGDGTPTLNVIVKGDVDGTLEAVLNTLDTYPNDNAECQLDLVHYAVGAVTETDLEMARTFNAVIYAFNVPCANKLQETADSEDIPIKHYNVIYKLVDDVRKEINKRLPTKETEQVVGEAAVLQQFEISDGRRKVNVAGCRCVKGLLKRSASYRLVRNGETVYEGNLLSMRHLKNEVDSIKKDLECGLQLNDKEIIYQPGDTLLCYEKRNEQQTTNWDPGF